MRNPKFITINEKLSADTAGQAGFNVANDKTPQRGTWLTPTNGGDERNLFGQGKPQSKDSSGGGAEWYNGLTSQNVALDYVPVVSRVAFEGTVTATDMDRATDAREKGRIGITGSNWAYAGSSPRVTSDAIGRDINPLGRGDGNAYVGGALNLGNTAPSLPDALGVEGNGNSINNCGQGGGCGGGTPLIPTIIPGSPVQAPPMNPIGDTDSRPVILPHWWPKGLIAFRGECAQLARCCLDRGGGTGNWSHACCTRLRDLLHQNKCYMITMVVKDHGHGGSVGNNGSTGCDSCAKRRRAKRNPALVGTACAGASPTLICECKVPGCDNSCSFKTPTDAEICFSCHEGWNACICPFVDCMFGCTKFGNATKDMQKCRDVIRKYIEGGGCLEDLRVKIDLDIDPDNPIESGGISGEFDHELISCYKKLKKLSEMAPGELLKGYDARCVSCCLFNLGHCHGVSAAGACFTRLNVQETTWTACVMPVL